MYINQKLIKVGTKIIKFLNGYIFPLFFILLPVRKNKIVFSSYYGKEYSDSSRAVSEYLHKVCPDVDIIWLLSKEGRIKADVPSYIKCVSYGSMKASYELSTAAIWVDNCRKMGFYTKRKNQKYIQCWHGTPLKRIERDAGDRLPKRYQYNAMLDSKNIDLLLSGNEYSTKIFKRCFWYTGEIKEWGTPRNDIFFNNCEAAAKRLRAYLNLKDEKIILFAPTFRNDINKNGLPQLEELNPHMLLKAFENRYSAKCVLLARFHPNVARLIDRQRLKLLYGDKFLEVSDYPDMHELMCGTDVLITDYSSSFFDFALLKRPIFLFMPDYDKYINERGFYIDIENIPLNTAKTISDLIHMIEVLDENNNIENIEKFLDYIGNKEKGNSSQMVVEYIMDKMGIGNN